VGAYSDEGGLVRFQDDLRDWFDEHVPDLPTERRVGLGPEIERLRAVQARLYDAGWFRWGWPESAGGLGGPPLLRAIACEQLVVRCGIHETVLSMTEVLGPTVAQLAPELAAHHVPRFLHGDTGWCQGFSEPDAGSDLANLRCRAVRDGGDYVISGQKLWTSFAQFADHCIVLARTGTPESRHRGITAFFVDMDSTGVDVRPLAAMNGTDEFAETYFDDVRVPADRIIGELDRGWQVAMSILKCERGGIFWMRSGWLQAQLARALGSSGLTDASVGRAYLATVGLRCRSWTTQHRLADGSMASTGTSIDKLLMGETEQLLFDSMREWSAGALELDDGSGSDDLRADYMYSRAGTIYGGTAEIQRNIIAEHILGMPKGAS